MELRAAIEGFTGFEEQCEVEVVTDSEVREERHHNLDSRVETQGLDDRGEEAGVESGSLKDLDEQVGRHTMTWTWTKGHADHADITAAMSLATQAARDQSNS